MKTRTVFKILCKKTGKDVFHNLPSISRVREVVEEEGFDIENITVERVTITVDRWDITEYIFNYKK